MKLKKIFLFIILVVYAKNYSQITTTKIEAKEKVKEKVKEKIIYDGKSNLEVCKNVEDYQQYIGQKIYTTKSFSPIYSLTGQRVEDYHNKYYTIKDVTVKKINSYSNDMVAENVFELNDEKGETFYYSLDYFNPKSVILVSYFLNLKKTYENKKYVIVSYWRENGFQNEATNEWVVINKKLYGGEWNCEVSVLEKDDEDKISYIMKSDSGEIISSESIDGSYPGKFRIVDKLDNFVEGGLFFMSIEDYNNQVASNNKAKKDAIAKNNNRIDKLTQKYGKARAELISKGKVEIGMNKEMCTQSWGIPLKTDVEKTKAITKETFIYGWSKKLYFENGKLVKIEY